MHKAILSRHDLLKVYCSTEPMNTTTYFKFYLANLTLPTTCQTITKNFFNIQGKLCIIPNHSDITCYQKEIIYWNITDN